MPEFYTIGCRVSGGVTGYRESLLKDAKGNVAQFRTPEEARKALPRSGTTANGVTFLYWINHPRSTA